MSDSHIDPLTLIVAALMTPKRKASLPTPEQIDRRKKEAERAFWNAQVKARKAAKKGLK